MATTQEYDLEGISIHLCVGIFPSHVGTVCGSCLLYAMGVFDIARQDSKRISTSHGRAVGYGRYARIGGLVDGQEWIGRRSTRRSKGDSRDTGAIDGASD